MREGWQVLQFYNDYIRNQISGASYLYTALVFILSSVILLGEWKLRVKCILRQLLDMVWLAVGWVVICSLLYRLVPTAWFSLLAEVIIFLAYGHFTSRQTFAERMVQQIVFLSCFILMLRISEAIGSYTDKLGWVFCGVSMTDVSMLVVMLAVAGYLRHFRMEQTQLLPRLYPVLMVAICMLAVATQLYSMLSANPTEFDSAARVYNLLLAVSFMLLLLLGYYLYYAIGREHGDKIMLLAQQRKRELDEENMIAAQQTYEALREVRHEIKNHTAYMKTLLDAGDVDGLRRYFDSYQARTSELVHYVSSGNHLVDAVVNCYVSRAKLYDIQFKTILAVPARLPYQDADLCSLLSNLLDNAIEAAAASGAQPKEITLSIRPQMDYYLIRVENPVDTRSIPARRRLTLQTTKENPELHGYGTKVIRRIAEQYGGTVKFSMKGERFIADVMLQNRETEEEEA